MNTQLGVWYICPNVFGESGKIGGRAGEFERKLIKNLFLRVSAIYNFENKVIFERKKRKYFKKMKNYECYLLTKLT